MATTTWHAGSAPKLKPKQPNMKTWHVCKLYCSVCSGKVTKERNCAFASTAV